MMNKLKKKKRKKKEKQLQTPAASSGITCIPACYKTDPECLLNYCCNVCECVCNGDVCP